MPAIAATLPAEIRDSGRLTVGVNVPYAPNEFKNSAGDIVGFDVDLIHAVTAAVHIPVIASGGMGTIDHLFAASDDGGAGSRPRHAPEDRPREAAEVDRLTLPGDDEDGQEDRGDEKRPPFPCCDGRVNAGDDVELVEAEAAHGAPPSTTFGLVLSLSPSTNASLRTCV